MEVKYEGAYALGLGFAAFGLADRTAWPHRETINEATEMPKPFGSDHGHTYVNGVLDQAAGQWRAAEINARR